MKNFLNFPNGNNINKPNLCFMVANTFQAYWIKISNKFKVSNNIYKAHSSLKIWEFGTFQLRTTTFLFICGLFNDTVNTLDYKVWNDGIKWMMNRKVHGRKWPWPNLRYYPGICLEGLRKTMRNLSQHSVWWKLLHTGQNLACIRINFCS
jgi:hypothetical protein